MCRLAHLGAVTSAVGPHTTYCSVDKMVLSARGPEFWKCSDCQLGHITRSHSNGQLNVPLFFMTSFPMERTQVKRRWGRAGFAALLGAVIDELTRVFRAFPAGNLRICSSYTVVTRGEIRVIVQRSIPFPYLLRCRIVTPSGGGHWWPRRCSRWAIFWSPRREAALQNTTNISFLTIFRREKHRSAESGVKGTHRASLDMGKPRTSERILLDLPPTNTADASVSVANSVSKHPTYHFSNQSSMSMVQTYLSTCNITSVLATFCS